MAGIRVADRNSGAGVGRALTGLRKLREDAAEEGVELPPFKLVVGARLVFDDGTPDIIAYPTTRHGWGRLTRMLTIGNRRTIKGDCVMKLENLLIHYKDMVLIAMAAAKDGRSDERRVGKECVRTWRSRWSQKHEKKKQYKPKARKDERIK